MTTLPLKRFVMNLMCVALFFANSLGLALAQQQRNSNETMPQSPEGNRMVTLTATVTNDKYEYIMGIRQKHFHGA